MLQSLNFSFRIKLFYAVDYVKVEGIPSGILCYAVSVIFRHVRKLRVIIPNLVLR
jgi:hypothetical protein